MLDEDGSDDYIQMIDQVLEWLDAGPSAASAAAGPSSSRASSKSHAPAAPVPEYTKRETHTIQINMDNLLGVRALEDQYIRALLMVDGVTSVTLDRVRAPCAIQRDKSPLSLSLSLLMLTMFVCACVSARGRIPIVVETRTRHCIFPGARHQGSVVHGRPGESVSGAVLPCECGVF